MTHAPRRYVPAPMTRERAILKGIEHAGRCMLVPPVKDALAAVYDELMLGEDHVRDCRSCRVFIALVREGFGDWISKVEIPAGATVSMTSYKLDD